MENDSKKNPVYSHTDNSKVNLSDSEWKKILPDDIYHIARQKGTERPWTSKFEKFDEVGTYYCAVCGNALFRSNANLKAAADGPASMNPSARATSFTYPIIRWACSAPK
jgi:peptide-methionine (R)-S-oxide reductase